MSKFKVGDVVKPSNAAGYIHDRLTEGKEYLVVHEEEGVISVIGEFKGYDSDGGWSEDWFELAVAAPASAESLRQAILDIRSKREPLQKEVKQLEEQEKELVAQLKGKGFALID